MLKKFTSIVLAATGAFLMLATPAAAQNTGSRIRLQAKPTVRVKKGASQDVKPNVISLDKVGGVLHASPLSSEEWPTDVIETMYGPQEVSIPQYGAYAMSLTSPVSFNSLVLNDKLNAYYGGFWANGKFYVIAPEMMMGELLAMHYYTFDGTTYELLNEEEINDATVCSSDLAYDETTGLVYGSFCDRPGLDGAWHWGSFNPETKEKVAIADIDLPFLMVGINSRGQAYGVDYNGYFYSIEKTTGALTCIGYTGVATKYLQSGGFDTHNDRLYWVPNFMEGEDWSAKSALFEINVHDGKATRIGDMPGNAALGALYQPSNAAADKAPAAVSDLVVKCLEGTQTCEMTYTAPAKTHDGSALSGALSHKLILDNEYDKPFMETSYQAGQTVTYKAKLGERGYHSFRVYFTNDAGESAAAQAYLWVGFDGPAAVGNLTATENSKKVHVSWTAPTTGEHDGYFDPATLTYDIVRQPDGKIIGTDVTYTEFDDVIESDALTCYTYHITPKASGCTGVEARTDGLTVGSSVALPYECRFSYNDFQLLNIIDANHDGNTWKEEDGKATYTYGAQDAYDWLVTPPLHVEKDKMYRFNFVVENPDYEFHEEVLTVAIGNNPDPETFTVKALDNAVVPCALEPFEFYFTADETGDLYIGFLCTSPVDGYKLRLSEITFADGPTDACPAQPVLEAKPIGLENKAELTISHDGKTMDGKSTTLTRFDIYRDNKKIGSIDNPFSNETYIDENAGHDNYIFYKVVPVNEVGEGFSNSAFTYLGPDDPTAPTNIRGEFIPGEGYKLEWDAPVVGEHGGNVDTDELVYDVYRYDNFATSFDKDYNSGAWRQDIEGTSQVMPLEYPENPTFYQFRVMSWSYNLGRGQDKMTDYLIMLNDPANYPAPLEDCFDGGKTHFPWSAFSWQFGRNYGFRDYGMRYDKANAVTDAAVPSVANSLFTGALSIKGSTKPTLYFGYETHADGNGDFLNIKVQRNAGSDITTVARLPLGGANSWELAEIDLSEFLDAEFINIYFDAEVTNGSGTAVDEIKIVRDPSEFVNGIGEIELQGNGTFAGRVYNAAGQAVSKSNKLPAGTYILSGEGKNRKFLSK